jgi:hypothetical protein
MYLDLRRPLRLASFLGVLALALYASAPSLARAAGTRSGRAAAHRQIDHQRCADENRKGSLGHTSARTATHAQRHPHRHAKRRARRGNALPQAPRAGDARDGRTCTANHRESTPKQPSDKRRGNHPSYTTLEGSPFDAPIAPIPLVSGPAVESHAAAPSAESPPGPAKGSPVDPETKAPTEPGASSSREPEPTPPAEPGPTPPVETKTTPPSGPEPTPPTETTPSPPAEPEPPTETTPSPPAEPEPPTETTPTTPSEPEPTPPAETKTTPPSEPEPAPPTETTPSPPPAEPEPPTGTTPTPPAEPESSAPTLLSAKAEDFGGQPADVLLTYTEAVSPSDGSLCVGVDSSGDTLGFGGVEQGPSPQTIRLQLVPEGSMPAQIRCPALVSVQGTAQAKPADTPSGTEIQAVSPATPTTGGVVSDPIDPKYLTELPFGYRSFWIQPWRAYLDTWPASRLLDSLGINFNVTSAEAEGTARLLQDSGFKLARIEISWNSLSYEDPTRFVNESSIRQRLVALREHGLRPLILLNANSGGPTPAKEVTLTTNAPASAGATTVALSPASATEVVPGKTGFDDLSFGGDPDILIASVNAEGVATLSKPLPAALAAGAHKGATLLYAPFGPPNLPNGNANPAFRATLAGWLSYVATVSKEAEGIFGAGGYDLEVWNELSFGSQFLNEENYYSPTRETGTGSVPETLLDETVAYIRDPAHGISSAVGITDGFASQTPFVSGAQLPTGTTAISKHLYDSGEYFPRDNVNSSIKPLNALGENDFTTGGTKANPLYAPLFIPTYHSLLPESFLTATQTETVVRDIAPLTTTIYGVPHGRDVGPPNGEPTQTWMTEYNINTNTLFPANPENPIDYDGPKVSPAQASHLQAEILLRSLVSMINKGMTREYFYAAAHEEGYNLISESFIKALDSNPKLYPGDELGGETMNAFRHMLAQFQGPGPNGAARQLELLSIVQEGDHSEFVGDGTSAHPDLYDREVLAVLPFQSSPTRFVIPVYVMTPSMTTVYNGSESESSISRFDLPNESFRITLGNLPETSYPPIVSAYDPMLAESTPARLVSRRGNQAVFEFAATDYPRLLEISYG